MNQNIKRLVEYPEIKKAYGEYTQLAVQLFEFFDYKFSIECIPIITITVEEVSKAIGVEESYLNEIMEIDERINDHQQFKYFGFETNLEYVLFLMFSYNIVITQRVYDDFQALMEGQVDLSGKKVISKLNMNYDFGQKSYELTFSQDFYNFLVKSR
jgi:hypothetical protein